MKGAKKSKESKKKKTSHRLSVNYFEKKKDTIFIRNSRTSYVTRIFRVYSKRRL